MVRSAAVASLHYPLSSVLYLRVHCPLRVHGSCVFTALCESEAGRAGQLPGPPRVCFSVAAAYAARVAVSGPENGGGYMTIPSTPLSAPGFSSSARKFSPANLHFRFLVSSAEKPKRP